MSVEETAQKEAGDVAQDEFLQIVNKCKEDPQLKDFDPHQVLLCLIHTRQIQLQQFLQKLKEALREEEKEKCPKNESASPVPHC